MGAAIGAISAVAPAGNALLQHYEANRQMNFQSEESAINRDWQTVEAEKARQFSAQQLQKQMDYNSPVYQSNELRKAGLNPVLAMQNGSAVASVSGGSSAPAASPVQGVSPVQGQPVDLNIPQAVQSMGAFLKSVAEAKKLGVQTDYLEQTFYDSVAKFHNEQTLSSLEVASKEMDNYIKHRVKDARIEQAWEELTEVGTRVLMNQASTHETLARADLDKALERMNDALAKYHGENALLVKLQVQNFARDFESMLNLRSSEAKRNRSQVDVNTSIKKLNDFQYEVNRNMQGAIEGSLFDSWQNKIKEGRILDWQVDVARAAAQEAGVRASHAELLFWKDFVLDVMSHGVGAFVSYKNAKSWSNLSKSSQSDVARKIQEMQYKYGDKFSTEQDFGNGYRERTESYEPRSH